MRALTRNEADTLDAFRELSRMVAGGRHVRTALIVDRNRWNGRALTPNQTNRSLAGLVRKGYLEKPARGWYHEDKGGEW